MHETRERNAQLVMTKVRSLGFNNLGIPPSRTYACAIHSAGFPYFSKDVGHKITRSVKTLLGRSFLFIRKADMNTQRRIRRTPKTNGVKIKEWTKMLSFWRNAFLRLRARLESLC